ncbi:DNA-binding protein [[Mannheimia] succiniciproducens]|uniref:DNA-binding protein n=1 Tax=Mannheimia succiniciproducens (strain KCTC 0769BP / MBEL55E) TaxID=221988 RepID=Q65QI7_MANSM|nr:DNA-binding protein [[Mannheimia] succiniciproducens]AAU38773.1 unknown [[Mannheimia] succiniciproducens MBEL55E]
MNNDLTTSAIARNNVLNNKYALAELETNLQLGGLSFEGETVFTKQQAAQILDVTERTIDNYIASSGDELEKNGYRILRGKSLKNIRLAYVDEMNFVDISPKAPSLGIFTFRALLNLAMLVTESERAKFIRSRMLDIVIDVIAQKSGGKTTFINQRDVDYLPAAYQEESYRKQFTNALRDYLEMSNVKYGIYTDKIYQIIFCENTKEYRQILKLAEKDKTRETMYAEVLKAIGSFETGLAAGMKQKSEMLGRKLTPTELNELLAEAASNPFLQPFILDARTKMSSRDLGFREVLHEKLEKYIQAIPENDFERFLGERSRSLKEQLEDAETLAVLQRLKDR